MTLEQAAKSYQAKSEELHEDMLRNHAADASFGWDGWDEAVWASNESLIHKKLREHAETLGFDYYELEQFLAGQPGPRY